MGQVSRYLRRSQGGYAHWCPGCEETHVIFDNWHFNGDLDRPTFSPSVKVTGKQTVKVNGRWTGEWVRGPDGKPLDECCHYFLTDGVLNFLGDCTHPLRGQKIPLPELPSFLTDEFLSGS